MQFWAPFFCKRFFIKNFIFAKANIIKRINRHGRVIRQTYDWLEMVGLRFNQYRFLFNWKIRNNHLFIGCFCSGGKYTSKIYQKAKVWQ